MIEFRHGTIITLRLNPTPPPTEQNFKTVKTCHWLGVDVATLTPLYLQYQGLCFWRVNSTLPRRGPVGSLHCESPCGVRVTPSIFKALVQTRTLHLKVHARSTKRFPNQPGDFDPVRPRERPPCHDAWIGRCVAGVAAAAPARTRSVPRHHRHVVHAALHGRRRAAAALALQAGGDGARHRLRQGREAAAGARAQSRQRPGSGAQQIRGHQCVGHQLLGGALQPARAPAVRRGPRGGGHGGGAGAGGERDRLAGAARGLRRRGGLCRVQGGSGREHLPAARAESRVPGSAGERPDRPAQPGALRRAARRRVGAGDGSGRRHRPVRRAAGVARRLPRARHVLVRREGRPACRARLPAAHQRAQGEPRQGAQAGVPQGRQRGLRIGGRRHLRDGAQQPGGGRPPHHDRLHRGLPIRFRRRSRKTQTRRAPAERPGAPAGEVGERARLLPASLRRRAPRRGGAAGRDGEARRAPGDGGRGRRHGGRRVPRPGRRAPRGRPPLLAPEPRQGRGGAAGFAAG